MGIEPTLVALPRSPDQLLADDGISACDWRVIHLAASLDSDRLTTPGVRPVCARKLRTKLATSV